MSGLRYYALAYQLGLTSGQLTAHLRAIGMPFHHHMSCLSSEATEAIREALITHPVLDVEKQTTEPCYLTSKKRTPRAGARLTAMVDHAVHAAVRQAAYDEDASVSYIVNRILKEALNA